MMKEHYLLEKDIIFLNHGSFGACPKSVFKNYQNWQRLLENQPVQFFSHDGYKYLEESRTHLSNLITCDSDDIIFIPNPTTAINTVIRSLMIDKNYEVLTSNHEYGAMIRAWEWFSKNKGYTLTQKHLRTPFTTRDKFLHNLWEGITKKTKIIFISHITSPTAIIFPVEEICKIAKERNIITIIDGAHAPAQLSLNVKDIDADFYCGACHKWMCSPKGVSFLYARKEMQKIVKEAQEKSQ